MNRRRAATLSRLLGALLDFYRFYLGRDAEGRLVAAMVFITEYTVHGPVRVAVALAPDGKVKGATVVEVTEETLAWIQPPIEQDFTRDYVGQDSRGAFALSERFAKPRLETMPQFYATMIGGLLRRAAIVYDVGIKQKAGT